MERGTCSFPWFARQSRSLVCEQYLKLERMRCVLAQILYVTQFDKEDRCLHLDELHRSKRPRRGVEADLFAILK